MKTFISALVLFLACNLPLLAQEQSDSLAQTDSVQIEVLDTASEEEPIGFDIVEVLPEFPGGDAAMLKYIAENLKYPKDARKQFIEGRVVVKFDVDEAGNVVDVTVVRGLYPSLDSAAVEVVRNMPRWKPGYNEGKPVRVIIHLPIRFQFEDTKLFRRKKKKQ